MRSIIPLVILLIGFGIGAVAGHYHGKAETLERFTLVMSNNVTGALPR